MKIIVLFLLRLYKIVISPILELIFGKACRFTPTCSEYAYLAIQKHGVISGTILSIKRILRCNGLSKPGIDPIP